MIKHPIQLHQKHKMRNMALLLVLTVLSLLSSANGQALSPSAKEFLAAHNQARAAVRVPPLQWSENLANWTRMYLNFQRSNRYCGFANLTNLPNLGYGGVQYLFTWTGVVPPRVTPRMAVDAWVNEKNYYSYWNNSCAVNHEKCGVYKQVVWKKSQQLGCAQGRVCVGSSLTLCFYNPPGNIRGQKPY